MKKTREFDAPGPRSAELKTPAKGSVWFHREHPAFIVTVVGTSGPNLSKRVRWVSGTETGETDIRAFNTKFEPLYPSYVSQ